MKTTTDFQLVATDKLIPYVNNARTHSPEQIKKLRSSLREFGFVNPVIIDREYNVIAGHGRLMAAKEEGITEVPCVYADHLTDAQKKLVSNYSVLTEAEAAFSKLNSDLPFTDVKESDYYYDAVAWALEKGITNGTTDTTFSPNAKCTRAQIVTFLWRSQKAPASDSVNPFTDVAADAYYTGAVLWAAENGITGGTTATTFSPDDDCTRAQIVTFLYRCLGGE